jgi:dolichol-phosphate mannosyltransferase
LKSVIVIPTYNEAHNIQKLVVRIFENYPHVHFIIVDDNSPDGTGEMADLLAEQYPSLQVIHRPFKAGLGSAYITGFKKALSEGADLIFEMDADFSHDPKYLRNFFNTIETADVVIGSRYVDGVRVEGWRFRRLLLSKAANMFVSYIMVKPIWDFTAGFRCYRRKVLESIELNKVKSDGYAFQIEMTYLAFEYGFRVKEIPILFKDRMTGESKISRNIVWEAFWLTLKCRAQILEIFKHLSFLFKDYKKFVQQND